jgi:hypothetical protein
MSERILSSLLLALVGAMVAFLLGLFFAISSSDGDNFRAAQSMCIGGGGALLICVALIIVALIPKAPEKRPATRRLPERSRAPVRAVGRTRHAGQEPKRWDQEVDELSHDLSHGLGDVEGEASLFLLDEPDQDRNTDGQLDCESPHPAPAFRELGRRVDGASTGLPSEPGFHPLGSTNEVNGSHGDFRGPVDGTSRKGQLCWICGKEHGPEIVHGTNSADYGVPEAWLRTAYDEAG